MTRLHLLRWQMLRWKQLYWAWRYKRDAQWPYGDLINLEDVRIYGPDGYLVWTEKGGHRS